MVSIVTPDFAPKTVAAEGEADRPSIAVLIPCKDEAVTIEKVVVDFTNALPGATIYVYDNNSSDRTADIAEAAGAVVGHEPRAGKGNVVRRMFSEIDANIYVLVDGDDTYDAAGAPQLVDRLVRTRSDMVVGARIGADREHARTGHALGNRLFNLVYATLFGKDFTDIFSGYRAFSRRFVKSFPALSAGFEIETELSVHASQLRLPVAEIAFEYRDRPEGSQSKLSTVRDGLRIMRTIVVLVKEYKPLMFFSVIAVVGAVLSILVAVPILIEFAETGNVEGVSSAVLATGIMIVSMLTMTAGVVLDSIRRFRAEMRRLFYNIS